MTRPRPHSRPSGFTLVELLVAIAVLAIIVVATSQILGTAATLTTTNNKHMDADDQARQVFDRLANDFARMVKRSDVDYVFWKNTPAATPITGVNDVMYFYTEGAGYFDNTTYNAVPGGVTSPYGPEKNTNSLVGYRVNNTAAVGSARYFQLERLGKVLSWDGGAWNSAQPAANSAQPNVMTYLTYPAPGVDVGGPSVDPSAVKYSTAYFLTTLAGAFSNTTGKIGKLPSAIGTEAKAFNDSADTAYHTLGSQVFRFEYSFQLKDGTFSDKPMMVASASNGVPSSTITSLLRPIYNDDSNGTNGTGSWAAGSRWWDKTNHIAYICLDATKGYAIWHELGVQDISAIIVTIAVIDKQGSIYVQNKAIDLKTVAAILLDYSPTIVWPAASTVTGNPAYLLDPTQTTTPASWAYALLPSNASGVVSVLPQSMVPQIRIYQRTFYLNNF